MAAHRRLLACSIVLLLWTGGLQAKAEDRACRPWEPIEIVLSAERELAAPYVDGLPEGKPGYVEAVFRSESGKAKAAELRLSGFWDGGRTWRIRFAPPLCGTWSYRTQSTDAGLDGRSGRIVCNDWEEGELRANPTRRGFVRVAHHGPRAGRHFEYADGTPMLWIGDTWWNWTKRGIPFERFKRLADDRAEKGFSVGQLFFAGRGWKPASSLLDDACRQPDLEQIRKVEEMIRYANSKGITVWLNGWWASPNMGESIGEENLRRWCRYMAHRLGAYNVVWVLAGEYNMHDYGGLGLDFWKGLGRLIDAEDPYERLIGAHPTPPAWDGGAAAPQWSTAETMHAEPWLDYHQSQVGHGRWRNEMIPRVVADAYRRRPAKPIVVTEPWYEFLEGNPTAVDIRFGAWSAILSGAAGHTYGGGHVWRAHVPEAPAEEGPWPLEMGFERDTLDYPGATSIGFMARTLRAMRWWRLEPHPELLLENPSPYCAAVPGEEYVAFLRWGGAAKLDLRPSAGDDRLEFRWIDLSEERIRKTGEVAGGAIREFRPPESFPGVKHWKDWVLHVRKKRPRVVGGP